MTADQEPNQRTSSLLRVLVPLLGSDVLEILFFLLRFTKSVFRLKTHEGMYTVLSYHAQLELLDNEGEKAILHKRQSVRFRQDNIIAYQDKAWGDGELFADYHCSPGVAVDRYREGHRYLVLISLRETKHAGDIEEFQIDRTIKDGFTSTSEDLQIDIDHVTQQLSMSIIFPQNRFPKEVTLKEQNSTRTQVLGPEYMVELPDGRREVRFSTNKPRLFEAYMLRWEW